MNPLDERVDFGIVIFWRPLNLIHSFFARRDACEENFIFEHCSTHPALSLRLPSIGKYPGIPKFMAGPPFSLGSDITSHPQFGLAVFTEFRHPEVHIEFILVVHSGLFGPCELHFIIPLW